MSFQSDHRDLIMKKTAKKQYAERRRQMAANMAAGGAPKKEIRAKLKDMDRTLKAGAKEEKKYLEAMGLLDSSYALIDQLDADVEKEDLSVVRQTIEQIKNNLRRVGKTYFSREEATWKQALERMDDAAQIFLQPGRIRPAKDPRAEDLRQAALALKERVQAAIPTEEMDFYTETKKIPGLLNYFAKGISAHDQEYALRKKAVIDKFDLLLPGFQFDVLDKKEIMRSIRSMQQSLHESVDPMADVLETEAPELPGVLRDLAKQFFPMQKANLKAQKQYDKAKAAFDKKVAKGKEAAEPAQPELMDTEAVRGQMLSRMAGLKERFLAEIASLQDKDYEEEALKMLDFFEVRQLSMLNR